MEASTLNPTFNILESRFFQALDRVDLDHGLKADHQSRASQTKTRHARIDSAHIDQAVIEECIGGILVFTDQQQLVYASRTAQRVLNQLQSESEAKGSIPNEIGHICSLLIQSRHVFPDQSWLLEFDIFTKAMTRLHICARWLNLEVMPHPCLLLTIADRQQAIVNLVTEEADRYGLTPREKDVWLLQKNDYTYKQIATELGITPNTVKKHMRSIYAKKRANKKIHSAVALT
jgi:DNA-binding CsgD family transcriptional regulator